jgi:hypothetical protein
MSPRDRDSLISNFVFFFHGEGSADHQRLAKLRQLDREVVAGGACEAAEY